MLPHSQPLVLPMEPSNWAVMPPTGVEMPMEPGTFEDISTAGWIGPRRRSFCGPQTEEEWEDLMIHRSSLRRESGQGTGVGLSGSGCLLGTDDPDRDVLCEYYGDMANRDEKVLSCGLRSQEGRRVLGNKPLRQRPNGPMRERTNYGSLASRRQRVMEEGGVWGDVEVCCVPVEPWHPMDMVCLGEERPEDVCVLRQTDTELYGTGRAFAADGKP
ncbi:hypothetical protein, conserved [Trypanosoma brucei gambiense DAL972]|uniref:Uncharacterized protein n=2 Tax=Trypanosoma brucei TaxID=5691 RepID=A0A3L6LCK0_9TRYP|nr:hypothetical protein, conserved [Trypanosoma brucei gambiense DAL972]RHW74018.1 hypothetical protein DPX39_020025200 [Trypanosoma brucei equiperdum]RHW74040.1 hypothetical protein DPX39_020026000 [Trypanosoma brucei equiperdum]CBH09616.1 hypothetical protein, conserved [Trypanosoma brucei gambiense DAL972]|eukprot:XP_011771920.1 hypothetical protein, conserved [Trypanosoma brucei gambiense DAL972]